MEKEIYLQSTNVYNFRHGKENPKVVGFINYTPNGYEERACFKVEYKSDNKIDFIPHSELKNGNWNISIDNHHR
jgi:hypothetical protein